MRHEIGKKEAVAPWDMRGVNGAGGARNARRVQFFVIVGEPEVPGYDPLDRVRHTAHSSG
ncbi:MAG: hypothetical protein WCI05_15340 [Myxococcales bacterium]